MEYEGNTRGGWSRGRRGGAWRSLSRGSAGQTRGVWRGQGNSNFTSSTQPQTPPPQPLGPVVHTINLKTLLVELDAPTIEDVRYVASYNWVKGKSPVILVPGSPPAWTPPAKDTRLERDSEDVFRDINAARYPAYPMEPAVRSVLAMDPEFEFESLDVVGCGSTLGSLMRIAGSQPKPFRFDVNVLGDTVFFVRRENSPTEIIADLQGYGHTFPEAYTTWDADAEIRKSCSHQRLVQYDFGGLGILIRTETDGYVKATTPEKTAQVEVPVDAIDGPSLEESLGAPAVGTQEPSQAGTLEIKMAGKVVFQDQIFDIKTRASYRPYNMEEILPRLWANQTPNFVIAYHQWGQFDQPKVTSVTQDILKWQTTNSSLLARYHALVKRIVDVVRDSDYRHFEVSWDGEGPLCITEQIGGDRTALPSDLLSLWDVVE